MSDWTNDELATVGNATELQLAPSRSDGSLWPYTTMWVVRTGDDLYVRSAGGPDRPWYRRAMSSGRGRIRAAASRPTSLSTRQPMLHIRRSMPAITVNTTATARTGPSRHGGRGALGNHPSG